MRVRFYNARDLSRPFLMLVIAVRVWVKQNPAYLRFRRRRSDTRARVVPIRHLAARNPRLNRNYVGSHQHGLNPRTESNVVVNLSLF